MNPRLQFWSYHGKKFLRVELESKDTWIENGCSTRPLIFWTFSIEENRILGPRAVYMKLFFGRIPFVITNIISWNGQNGSRNRGIPRHLFCVSSPLLDALTKNSHFYRIRLSLGIFMALRVQLQGETRMVYALRAKIPESRDLSKGPCNRLFSCKKKVISPPF